MTNPHDPNEVLPVMDLSYSLLEEQKQGTHEVYLFFKMILMFLFYASIVEEVRDLIKMGEFLGRFPGVEHADDRGGRELQEHELGPEGKKYRVTGISRKHRVFLATVFALRIFILFVLFRFGSWFLLSESRYIELVLNALALSFITGIDELLYSTFMETSEKHEDGYDETERMLYKSVIPGPDKWIGFIFRKECWGLLFIPCLSVGVVLWNAYYVRRPIVEALTCTCLQEGDHCAESMVNQGTWWLNYWKHVLPAAIHQIEALQLQGM